jgi:glutathione S-transferase
VEEHHPEHKKSVPLVKELESGKWLADSPKIADYLEDKHPDPKLGKSTDPPAV